MAVIGLKIFLALGLIVKLTLANIFPSEFDAEKEVKFLLRLKNKSFNDEAVFDYEGRALVGESLFDKSKPTTFLIHGYMENRRLKHHLDLSK